MCDSKRDLLLPLLDYNASNQKHIKPQTMNSLPATFYECVFALAADPFRYKFYDNLTGAWSPLARDFFKKRRNLSVFVSYDAEREEHKFAVINLRIYDSAPPPATISISTLDPRFDQINRVALTLGERSLSFEDIWRLRKLLLLTTNCRFSVIGQFGICGAAFECLKLCRGLSSISIPFCGPESVAFVRLQVEYGVMRSLLLRGENWPQELCDVLHKFVSSPRFFVLNIWRSNLALDLRTVGTFLTRWANGELNFTSRIAGALSFSRDALTTLLPECLIASDENSIEWVKEFYGQRAERVTSRNIESTDSQTHLLFVVHYAIDN